MVFSSRSRGDQAVAFTVKNESRLLEGFEDPAQGPLVGVVEVARVGPIEGKTLERAKVREEPSRARDEEPLHTVDHVVQGVVAEQLVFLRTDGGEQHQRFDSLRRLFDGV